MQSWVKQYDIGQAGQTDMYDLSLPTRRGLHSALDYRFHARMCDNRNDVG